MKVLVLGSGGREHAICWKLRQAPRVTDLWIAPGNPGTAQLGTNLSLRADAIPELVKFAQKERIDLTVVGPEQPLAAGVVDAFVAAGLKNLGPSRRAAELEGSKCFAKEVMTAAGVPTAAYQVCQSAAETRAALKGRSGPLVLKADGLAAGKGVVVCRNVAEAEAALPFLFDELKSSRLLIEECLTGKEASYIVATDGQRVYPLAGSHDYKRIRDHDQGPNTGGMGTVSPTPHLTAAQEQWVLERVIRPTLAELARRDIPYCGFLYAGLMISPEGEIRVLEFNARLGDPETQVILRRMKGDFFELLWALSTGGGSLPEAEQQRAEWLSDAAVCVVLAAAGYPEAPEKGSAIAGVSEAERLPGVVVFQAGTVEAGGRLQVAGGRVLNVTATGPDVESARRLAYRGVGQIKFAGAQWRSDIGEA